MPQLAVTYLADKRHQMVFAHGEHLNVFDDDHLIMILIKYCIIQNIWKDRHGQVSNINITIKHNLTQPN